MAQLCDDEIISKILCSEASPSSGLLELVDRTRGVFLAGEGQFLDFKEKLELRRPEAIGELARDILGFSNSEGGILIFGITDSLRITGHGEIDSRLLRNSLGPYIGTRIDYDVDEFTPTVGGVTKRCPFIVVRRSLASYPALLRRHVELRPGLVRKVKYCAGSLFYRQGTETFVEPVGGNIEECARELRFSGAAPRTRSSFLLLEDKPGLRLYQHINDRFYGRETEVAELLAKFDDVRGKGVSLAGLGGVGKTELAIKIVSELFRRGKFRNIYSGSAKQSLLGPSGPQQADPAFKDYRSFVRDLGAWLGINSASGASADEVATDCISELSKLKKVLLFVDNLETISDRHVFDFLDNKLPNNCWIITTGRVHKVRVNVFPKDLREMDETDAARLLRHEVKRQGFDQLAATHIDELRKVATRLLCHPLAIRWFAWACRRDESLWLKRHESVPLNELESFCVAHTLENLPLEAQKVLGAMVAIKEQATATAECLAQTSRVTGAALDQALFELECARLLSVQISDETGLVTYLLVPLAEVPARDLARTRGWEGEYISNLNKYLARSIYSVPQDPLIRDLLSFDARRVRSMSKEEMAQVETRVDRALPRCSAEQSIALRSLKAECERHLGNLISADELYQACAVEILKAGVDPGNGKHVSVLLEAATVAKGRSHSKPQIERAISYLEAIQQSPIAPLRVLGMLTEFFAMVGDRSDYEKYRKRVTHLRDSSPGRYSQSQLLGLEEALHRANTYLSDQRG